MNTNKEIPIFYSVDDNYIPCLAVALESLIAHTSRDNNYRIIILNTGISNENVAKIMKYESTNVKISFEDISSKMQKLEKELELRIRDYYTITIYYRLFIASLFPQIDKAIYLDADMLVLDDVAKIYNVDMGNNLIEAIFIGLSAGAAATGVNQVGRQLTKNEQYDASATVLDLKKFIDSIDVPEDINNDIPCDGNIDNTQEAINTNISSDVDEVVPSETDENDK